jgi:hypothetical protein
MIINGNNLRLHGDKIAISLFKEYDNTMHTSFEGLSKEQLDELMTYLKITNQQ